VQHLISGETHYFREWSRRIALLLVMLSEAESDPATKWEQEDHDDRDTA
jgi:hypothetical protein